MSDVAIVGESLRYDAPYVLYPFSEVGRDAATRTDLVAPEIVLMRESVTIGPHEVEKLGLAVQVKDGNSRGLIRLGRTHAARYRLSVDISEVKSHWEKGRIQEVGLYYGGRWQEPAGGAKFYRATTLGILHIPDQPSPISGLPEYLLEANLTQTMRDGIAIANEEIPGMSGYLGEVDGDRHRLDVEIGPAGVEMIQWDGKPVENMSDFPSIAGHVPAEDFVGDFGLSVLGCNAVFHRPTITILPEDEN